MQLLLLSSNWEEKLELWWKLVFGVESVWEVNSSDSTVGMDLYSRKGVYCSMLTWEFQCSWFRRPYVWNQTSWTGSDSIPRPDAWAWYRWKALLWWCSGSLTLWTYVSHSCHQAPALRRWSTSWAERVNDGGELTFLMIMTRKGSLMPSVLLASAGQVMKLVETLVPMISRTEDWMSGSVILLMCPLRTDLSQICRGFELKEL